MSTNDTESPPSTSDGSALPNLFKRSYHQLDGAEDVAGNSSSSSPAGSERHKRARSEPRSETGASSAEAGSSAMESSAEPDTLSATLEQLAAMPGPSHSDHVDSAQRDTSFSNQYELSMERFNSFNEQIQPLREASPVVERHSPPSSENPHDEDEIMEQLFADPARSSQSWRDNHNSQPGLPGSSYAPYASLPHPEEVIEIVDARRNAEREVVVIEDSDDEVQIIDPPSRALFSGPADPPPSTSAPSYRAEDTWSGHWDTWNAGRNPWLDTPENEPNRFRTRHDSLPSSQLRDRPQPFTSGSSTERRTRLQSFSGAGTGRESNPWSNPYIYSPPSSLSLTAEEQEMFRHRRLADARRRMDEQRSEPPEREPDVEEVLRRIREASDRALSPFTIEEIQPSTRDSIPRPASPRTSIWPRAGARADSSTSDFRTDARATSLEALRSATEMGNARIAEILASMDRDSSPAPTSSSVERLPRTPDSASANSESMRRSLVMEGLFSDNPDMGGTWRPASRRSVIVEEIQPGTSSSNRPSSPQTARRSDRPQTNRPAPSRPPSWLTTTPGSGSFEVRPRNPAITPSSTESSIASFVTADTSFEDNISLEQAASTAAAHAPAVSSPLRESYRAASPARPSPAPSAQPTATQSGTTVGGVNANDVVSRLQSLSGLLTSMAASPHASDAVRDSALRMIASGHELMRAIDAERQPNPTRNAPSSSSGAADDASSSAGSLSSDRATTGRVRPYTPGSSASASLGYAPDRHPGTGARLQALRSSLAASARASTPNRQRPSARHVQVMDLSDRTRAEAFEPLGTSSASGLAPARNVQNTRNENPINERSLRTSDYLTQAEPDRTRRTEHIADRWSQARQRRRELQDALLAEEPRLQSLRRSNGSTPSF
ncbi:hypothetical protein BC629DRAFT_471113 [Irpex lacteus]|nr:hypothetical protein BC629DRAFT_471113 [Irpex lacteus]